MKSTFFEYYSPSAEEINILWKEALVVVDTNVLLEPYNLPKEGRDALLKLFRSLSSRIWIPHQVGIEFQRNRQRCVASARDITEKALVLTESSINSVIGKLQELRLHEREIDVDSAKIIKLLGQAQSETLEAIRKAHEAQPVEGLEDPIRDELDAIFEGRVGPPITTQKDLDSIYREGAARYESKTPPGYMDSEKGGELYSHGGLRFQNKYGDLVAWTQLLNHVKANSVKKVIFVTLEKKADWWVTRGKEILGPRPELLRELREVGGVELAWMFRLPDFMSQSNTHLSDRISDTALGQVQAAEEERTDWDWRQFREVASTAIGQSIEFRPGNLDVTSGRAAEMLIVRRWMIDNGAERDAISLDHDPYDVVLTHSSGRATRYDIVVCNASSRRALRSISERIERLRNRTSLLGIHGGVLGLIVIVYAEEMNDFARAMGEAHKLGQDIGLTGPIWDVELIVGVAHGGTFLPAFHYNPLDSDVTK